MLSLEDAKKIINKNIPGGKIVNSFKYGSLYVFLVDFGDPDEALYDAYYSVDSKTGKFAEFSMITDYIDTL